MKHNADFWAVLIGNGSAGTLLGFIVVGFICAFASLLIQASNRDIASTNTPVLFSWKFLRVANAYRLVANILLIPIAIRLTYQYVPSEWMLFATCGLGFGVDRLAMLAQKYGILTTDKAAAKLLEKLGPEQPVITSKPTA